MSASGGFCGIETPPQHALDHVSGKVVVRGELGDGFPGAMPIDDRFALHCATHDRRLAKRSIRIERDDPRLSRFSPPRIEPCGQSLIIEHDALEAVLDHLANGSLAAMCSVDELAELLDEDPAPIRAKRRRQQRAGADRKST